MPSTTTLLLFLLTRQKSQRARLTFRDNLSLRARCRRDRRITRRALQQPTLLPFTFLFHSTCDQSLITLTGVDHRSFVYMLHRFQLLFMRYTPYSADGRVRILQVTERRGRPRSMNATHCLGLLLAWHRTRGSLMNLTIMFEVTASVASLFIRFARRLLLRILCNDANSIVRMPSAEESTDLKTAFSSKYHSLPDVYAVVDGL